MKLTRWLVIICVVLLLVYGASPYFSFWRFTAAVQSLIDAIIDAYVTPEGIAALLENPEALKNLKAPREFHFELGKNEDLSKVKYAFFTGPRSFVVDRDGISLRFHFTASGWQLYDLDLGLTDAKR
jgi:hypothetical protein